MLHKAGHRDGDRVLHGRLYDGAAEGLGLGAVGFHSKCYALLTVSSVRRRAMSFRIFPAWFTSFTRAPVAENRASLSSSRFSPRSFLSSATSLSLNEVLFFISRYTPRVTMVDLSGSFAPARRSA